MSSEQDLNDLAKWWSYHHRKNMQPEQFVEFQDKYDQMTLRLFASMLQRIHELEEKTPKIVLPTGLQLNDRVRT